MIKTVNINVDPRIASDYSELKKFIAKSLGISDSKINHINIKRRSVDARGRKARINLGIDIYLEEDFPEQEPIQFQYNNVSHSPEVIIVGAGPAGLFAALRLIELGLKPVVIERGKDVSARKADIAAIHRNAGVDPDSNYGYGEGGAGTFSDGKLYTRSKKRGNVRKILEVLYFHGAQPEILIDTHPHIGTNVLPKVIKRIRQTIIDAGGEVHFEQRVVDFVFKESAVAGVKTLHGNVFTAKAVILATGHSARDIYHLLREKGIHLEAKNFAIGVRVEHPQELIDSIQYNRKLRGKYLPPATYSFTEQVNGRGVYSFCMCPGGVIVPAATAANQIVVNGMSPSHRGGAFANSGIVVEVKIDDLRQYSHYREMAGLKFQDDLESMSYKMGGNTQIAPAQRLVDFVKGLSSSTLPATSYKPGIVPSDLHKWMPQLIRERLQTGFRQIDKKARGFLSEQAIVIGVESRTSSPIRIPRNEESFEHVKIKGIFPCGEGAGYAGGIVSSAVDGELCAEKVAFQIK